MIQPKLLTIQPFYGGSHRQFIDGWIKHSSLDWEVASLPARHWKWRMRHAAVHFAGELDRRFIQGERWDLLVCTDMLNVAEFKGLLKSDVREIPVLVYFHENQFEYPNQVSKERDLHFAFTNFTTLLAADYVWFNSGFNRDSLFQHLREHCQKWPDFTPENEVESIHTKTKIEPPGVQFAESQVAELNDDLDRPIHIVWAARWEHDKGPDQLLQVLEKLSSANVEFQLSVLGEQFSNVPDQFALIYRNYRSRIRNWGYQTSRTNYLKILGQSDIFLSTAHHEFFGLSVVEAVCCGCFPLLPNRLVYPELLRLEEFPDRSVFIYERLDEAVDNIKRLSQSGEYSKMRELRLELTREFQLRYRWHERARSMDEAICEFLSST